MTGNQVIGAVSQDVRSVLGTTGTSQTILMDYTSRIQQDILHNSFYNTLNKATATVNTASGTASYALGITPRRVLTVYDRTKNRVLMPLKELTAPLPQLSEPSVQPNSPPEPQVNPFDQKRMRTQTGYPEYYSTQSGNIIFYPTPLQTSAIEILYNQQVPRVTDATAVLTIPDDAFDMCVAGVNYLANLFLARQEPAQFWGQLYEKLKLGEQE